MESSGYVDKLSSVAGQASKEEAYWLNRLSGELGKSSFPYDYGKIGRPRRTMETCRFQFTGPVYSRIMKMVNGSYPRLHMVLSAALVSLLYTYGSSDIMVGTSIYKQEIDGEFINTVLALRCRLEAAMTFKEVILQVREVITAAVEHQNFPIEFILQELGIPLGKNDDFPLFDVGILLENIQDKAYIRHIRLQMLFSFLDSGDSLEAAVEYNGALYKQETVADLLKRFDQLLCQVLENVNLSLADLDILTDEEKRRLLLTFNRTGAEYPREQTIIELFRRQVEKTPDHTAVVHDRHQVTYNRLDRAAGLLSGRLCQRGVKRESLVALQGAPSLAAILGIVGILKTGAAYLPLDPETPGRRLEYIVKDSRPTLLLFTGTFPEAEQGIFPALPPDRLISLDDRSLYTSVPEPDRPRRENCGQPRDVAYVIYTSGTTARPKGVMVHQQGLVNYVWWAAGRYVRNERGNFPLFTSIAFDLTVTSIFTPLITGNAVVVYAYREEGQAIPVEEIIRQNRVDIVKLTPSHLRIVQHISGKGSGLKRFIVGGEELDTSLAREISRHFNHPVEIYNEYGPTETVVGCMCHRYDPGSDNGPSVPLGFPIANMRVYLLDSRQAPVPTGVAGELYISGDGLARGYLNNPELTQEKFGHDLWDLHDYHNKKKNDKLLHTNTKPKNIKTFLPGGQGGPWHGAPWHGEPIMALRSILRLTELFAAGVEAGKFAAGLTKMSEGHLRLRAKSKELRANSPSTNPLDHYPTPLRAKSQELRAILYKTGDLGRWLAEGTIQFLGRSDHQVKIRGYRVEPGEIESRLLTYPGVKEAVVSVQEDESGDHYLVAYVVGPGEEETPEIREYLVLELPDYMIPSGVVPLDNLPLTPHGKIDRSALPRPGLKAGERYTAPRDEIERKLVEIWSDILARDAQHAAQLQTSLGIDDNFFQRGGHSLKAVILLSMINKQFQVKLPLAEIFKRPDIRQLAHDIRTAGKEPYKPITAAEKKEYYQLSPSQKSQFILWQMEPESKAYNILNIISLPLQFDQVKLEKVLKTLLERHEILRTSIITVGTQPVQRIEPRVDFSLAFHEEGSQTANEIIAGFSRPFDLARAPFPRAGLIKTASRFLLALEIHHIITDYFSQGIVIAEFFTLYRGESLPGQRLQYKDYAEWLASGPKQADLHEQEAYWLNRYSEEIPAMNLPLDFPRPQEQSFAGGSANRVSGREEARQLKALALEEGLTVHTVFLSLLYILLWKVSGAKTIDIGVPVLGRRHADLQGVIGMFLNTVVLRNHPDGEKSVRDFFQEVNHSMVEALENQEYPFDQLVERVLTRRDPGRNPLFDVMFVNNPQLKVFRTANLLSESTPEKGNPNIIKPGTGVSQHDITLNIDEDDDRFVYSMSFRSQLFKEETIRCFLGYFQEIQALAVENRDLCLQEITMSNNLVKPEPGIREEEWEDFDF